MVSNNSDRAVHSYLTRNGLDDRIDLVVARTSHDPALLKPSPHLIETALEALGAEPGVCAFVGDSTTDIEAARLVGVPSIGYANRPGKRASLTEAGADAVGLIVGAQHGPKRVRHRDRVEQLVLHHVYALEERSYGREQPTLLVELPHIQPGRLPRQERGQLVVVQDVVRLIPRHPLLEQAEAERMDGPHKQPCQPVQRCRAEPVLDPVGDTVPQLLSCTLSERERHNRLSRLALSQQIRHALRHHLRLSGTSGGDDLKMASPMADCIQRRPGQFRRCWTNPSE